METSRQGTIISFLITFLLLVQVILSTLIIKRLNDNDRTLDRVSQHVGFLAGLQQPEVPMYVRDVSVDDDPMLGQLGAPVTIIEFADFECPYCAEAAQNIEAILAEYGNQVLFVYRDFPLDTHTHAFEAAQAANCAGEQEKYWEMHALLFENQTQLENDDLKEYASRLNLNLDQFNTCLNHESNEITLDINDAQFYQVRSVPTFFVNGYRVEGSNYESLLSAIARALKNAE